MSDDHVPGQGIDDLVAELLHEYARLERRLDAADRALAASRRSNLELKRSRDRWKEEVRNLKFQLQQRRATR